MQDLPIKDLQQLRERFVNEREDVKKAAELEDRDFSDTDIAELERLANEIRNVDKQLKVKREDQAIAKSAVLAGETSDGASAELRAMSKRFDLGHAVREITQGKRVTGVAAEYTAEAMREANVAGVAVKGQLTIPGSVLRAVGDAGEFGAGSGLTNSPAFVGTDVAPGVEGLSAPTMFERMGGRVLSGLTANTNIPLVGTSETNIGSVAEGAAPSGVAGTGVSNKSLSPTRYSGFVTITEQLILQGGPVVQQLIQNDILKQINRQIDKAVFLAIMPDNADGDALEFDKAGILAGEAALVGAGIELGNVSIITDTAGHGVIDDAVNVAGVSAVLNRDNVRQMSALGYPYYVTDLLPDTAGTAAGIMMDANMAGVLGLYGGLDVVINPYTLDINHQVRVSVHKYAGTSALHAGAAYTMRDDAA